VTYGVTGSGGFTGTDLAAGSGTIAITFPVGVVLPATIDKTRISVSSDVSGNFVMEGFPLTSDPSISGQTITITVPATDSGGSVITNRSLIEDTDNVSIFFSQLAGIINPAKSGAAGKVADSNQGKVTTSTRSANSFDGTPVTFNTTISVSTISAAEGDEVVVTVGGFTPGLTVSLNSGGAAAGSAVVGSDRKAVITGTRKGTGTTVSATDTAGVTSGSKTIALKPSLTSTATGKAGDTITLTGKNFTDDSNIASVASILFGGNAILTGNVVTTLATTFTDKDADGVQDDFAIKFTIPSNAKSGVNQIKMTDVGTATATATVTVEGRSVTISPDSGPPGTVVTIVGSGFPASDTNDGNNTSSISPIFGSTTKTNLFTDGSGSLPGSDQFTIPSSSTASVITLTVSIQGADGVASTGSDKFTVTSRVLTVTPTSGPRGTKVLITGTKFTASGKVDANEVTVDGVETIHALANLTSSGDVPGISLSIPSGAGIGLKTISLADNGANGTNDTDVDDLVGTTKFTITVPTITVALDTATMGHAVPVTGAGWVPGSSVTITLKSATVTVATKVATTDGSGGFETSLVIPSTVGVGTKTVTFTAADATTFGNTATAQNLIIPKPLVTLSTNEAEVGVVVEVEATGFPPSSGLSVLTIGGADVRTGVSTSDTLGSLSTSFIVPGVTGSNIITVTIGASTVSTSISVLATTAPVAAATDTPADIFADVIANEDNLVRVWRFDNATQGWDFYDPRPAFEAANTLEKSGAGDIVWVNVTAEQAFQGGTLFPGWNLISLN
jgi:hypothetical protein